MVATQKVTHLLYLSEVEGRSPFSGAENHVFALLPALARDGVDVEMIAILWFGTTYSAVLAKLAELAASGVTVNIVKRRANRGPLGHHLSFVRAWAEVRRLLRARPDRIVHIHLDYIFAPIVARLAGCKRIVLSVHCDEPVYQRRRSRLWFTLLNRIVVHYIAITDHVLGYFQKVAGVEGDHITRVYYGVEIPGHRMCREDFALPEGVFVVGFVGRLAEQKNLETFIEALALRRDVLGVLVGDGPLRASLEGLMRAREIENVRFLGVLPIAAQCMPMFDLFCLPSHFEGLGLVLVEAMLQRVPIIGSSRGAIPEVLGDGEYGLLFEPNPLDLVAALDYARSHPEEMRHRADQAYEYARSTYSVSKMVAGTRSVYRLVEQRRP